MQKVLTAEQMRDVDRLTTEKYGIPSIILMENAAHAVVRVITEKLGGTVKDKKILILCGKGNNGGDGAALGRILWRAGAFVVVELFGGISDTKRDSRKNFEVIKGLSASDSWEGSLWFREWEPMMEDNNFDDWLHLSNFDDVDIVVDALFGTGLKRPLDGFFAELTGLLANWKHSHKTPFIIAVDIPSGLSSDFGATLGSNIDAHCTVAFTAPKAGNVTSPASHFNGELIIADIGSPRALLTEQPSLLFLGTDKDARDWLEKAQFSEDSYKNRRGHALVIAGSESYSGAAVLAGDAAMRSGAGLVTVVTPKSSKDSVASRILPEVMVRGVAETENGAISEGAFDDIGDILGKADSIAVGCGLSQSESTRKFVENVIATRRVPVIVDADALNLLSPFVGFAANGESQQPLILTPHEGEFMRLLGTDDRDAIKDRVAAVRDFATKHGVILVLKGERVLIGEPGGKVVVNPTGNSGLGKAGNGDTLTGILAGFIAQAMQFKIDIFETVVAAVYVAGMAGDIAEKKYGKRVMTASDVRECLSEVFKEFKNE